MINEILNFKRSIPSIGLYTRKFRFGPERSMLKKFITDYSQKIKSNKDSIAIFQEPMIETGFPDVVFVKYNPNVFDKWTKNRVNLDVDDIKLLHYLHNVNGANADVIKKQIGMKDGKILHSIERLIDAKLVTRQANQWVISDLESIFGVKQIIAVEAKIADTTTVVNQARANMWYASESYILSSIPKPSNDLLASLQLYGVGIISLQKNKFNQIQPPAKLNIPSSYLSWIFNEWIGRKLFHS